MFKRFLLVLVGVVAAVFLVLYDVDLLRHHLTDVQGNLEASVIWGTPTVVLFFARSELRHRKQLQVQQAHHVERMAHLDSLHAKVDALHAHLGVPAEATGGPE